MSYIRQISNITAIFGAIFFVTFIGVLATPSQASACEWYDALYQPWECFEDDDSPAVAVPEPTLDVYCSANQSSVRTGDTVTWTANTSGGNGSYSYSWSGSENLFGSSRVVYKNYYQTGTKSASVSVTSGNQTRTVNCNQSVSVTSDNDDDDDVYGDLDVYCEADDTSVEEDDRVEWEAYASGGTGNYSYSWSGTDGLSGSGRTVSKRYTRDGYKDARVRVTSGGQSITRDCDDDVRVEEAEDDDDDLTVTCYANYSQATLGSTVVWRANVDGGSSSNYRYDWEGTDNLSSSNSSVSRRYTSAGSKYATLEVRSGSETERVSCGYVNIVGTATPIETPPTVVYRPSPPVVIERPTTVVTNTNNTLRVGTFDAVCSPNTKTADTGDTITWDVQVTGGNGVYNYTWSGTDGLYSLSNTALMTYDREGEKIATITVTSNGQSITRSCISAVTIGEGLNDLGQGAAAIFGLGNISWGFISFFLIIILLCIIGYLVFTKKKS